MSIKAFLSTLSLRRATSRLSYVFFGKNISIHALLAESDLACSPLACTDIIFLSTLSLRRATTVWYSCERSPIFLSTLSLRRATTRHRVRHQQHSNFYPRSPCGERQYHIIVCVSRVKFLSTLSLRRATKSYVSPQKPHKHFYPRSPCGERQQKCTKQ